MTDTELTIELKRAVFSESVATSVVVAMLAEFDARRLYLPHGYSSLFAYCVQELKLTEDATFNRVEAARAARKFPRVLELLATGELSLTAARLLAPHLTDINHVGVLQEARHKTKKEIELLVARLRPRPPVASIVRKLPERRLPEPRESPPAFQSEEPVPLSSFLANTQYALSPRPIVTPLSESHYKLQVTISAAAHERLRSIQALMRHTIPNGDPAAIVERALELLYAELLKKKAAQVAKPGSMDGRPAPKGRLVPASVRRKVWERDGGRCAFVGDGGKRCGAAGAVEFHHVDPYAHGGAATIANIELRCRAHNGFEWERRLDEVLGAESAG